MKHSPQRLIVDLDGTLCHAKNGDYANAVPVLGMVEQLTAYREQGFEIVIHTSRNMRTHEGNVGKINAHTLPIIVHWLDTHRVPYDEIYVGKPWCGLEGIYIDDRAVRPREFMEKNYSELMALIERDSA